jgi:hypothetical protein
MAGVVREEAHALGAHIEKMLGIVGAVGEAAAGSLGRADEEDPRLRRQSPRELDR